MEYKGYSYSLSGVYKVENNKKLYSLEIYKDNERIYKTDWIYENEKRAFNDAKDMIKNNRFDTEIIRKNTNRENLKNDKSYKRNKDSERTKALSLILNQVSNAIIVITLICMIIAYIVAIPFLNVLGDNILFGGLYVILGLIISIITLIWGIYAKGGLELDEKQKKAYKFIWWLSFLLNPGPTIGIFKAPTVPYNDQPFRNKEKGWYSSTILIALIFEGFFAFFITRMLGIANNLNTLFYAVIISYIFLIVNYIFTVIWEITDSELKDGKFPYKRVFVPIFTVAALAAVVYFRIKIFGYR